MTPIWSRASGEYQLTGYVWRTEKGWQIQTITNGKFDCPQKMTGTNMFWVKFEVEHWAYSFSVEAESKVQAYFIALEILNANSDKRHIEFPKGVIIEEQGWTQSSKSMEKRCESMPKTLSEL